MKDKLYKLMSWPEIEAIVYGDTNSPQDILGRHYATGYTLFQTFNPSAQSINVCFNGEKKKAKMELADEAGFFAVAVPLKESRDYVYEVTYKDSTKKLLNDPYLYNPKMDKSEVLSWNKGTSLHAYKYMGSQFVTIDGIAGVRFRVWAPNATRVSVVGEFNNWDGKTHPMIFDAETGVFSLFIPNLTDSVKYRYEILTKGGETVIKNDPYAVQYSAMENCSVVTKTEEFSWTDEHYMSERTNDDSILNVFEVDNSLWDANGILSDKSLNQFCKYIKELSYTHVLVSVIDNNIYCMDNRIDTMSVKKLINGLHNEGIGVLIKWNPCYFSPDEYGMKVFDGTYLYGHLDERKRYNAMFGYNYNYGREQVDDYLNSNLIYWFEEFHVDGIHVEDLSTMLRLDYGRNDDFVTNIYGGTENLEAINYIKKANTIIHERFEGCISMTKETSMYPKVTYSVSEDGLGFDYIWDNGFGDDYREFIKTGAKDINKLTDSMAYAYSENYILTISKEDVIAANNYDSEKVEAGSGYFDSLDCDDTAKMALKRATLGFFMAHPGKKLMYIGQDEKILSSKLNELYITLPAFSELDRYVEGFEWVNAFNNGTGVISFIRKSEIFKDNILVVCNFSSMNYDEFKLGVPYEGKYKCFLNTSEKSYGGDYKLSAKAIASIDEEYDGKECVINVELPAMSVSYYSYEPYSEEEFLKIAAKKAAAIKKELELEASKRAKELEAEAKRKAKEYNSLTRKIKK